MSRYGKVAELTRRSKAWVSMVRVCQQRTRWAGSCCVMRMEKDIRFEPEDVVCGWVSLDKSPFSLSFDFSSFPVVMGTRLLYR